MTGGTDVPAAAHHPADLDAAWFEPFRPWAARSDPRPAGRIDLAQLNALAAARGVRTEDGLPLCFIDARASSAAGYEASIGESGAVPTRAVGPGMLHDWFNALAWLAFPRIKARLNRLHRHALAVRARGCAGGGTVGERGMAPSLPAGRGLLRDAATLLDESGALFLCRDPALAVALRNRDWRALFVDQRARFAAGAAVRVLGHGLCEKLRAPYKSVCAHAWLVELPSGLLEGVPGEIPDETLDAAVAQQLRPDTLRVARLHPLPLLGVPGWWPPNADPAFYDDARVFRRERRER